MVVTHRLLSRLVGGASQKPIAEMSDMRLNQKQWCVLTHQLAHSSCVSRVRKEWRMEVEVAWKTRAFPAADECTCNGLDSQSSKLELAEVREPHASF